MMFQANLAPTQRQADDHRSCGPLGTSRDQSAPSCRSLWFFRQRQSLYDRLFSPGITSRRSSTVLAFRVASSYAAYFQLLELHDPAAGLHLRQHAISPNFRKAAGGQLVQNISSFPQCDLSLATHGRTIPNMRGGQVMSPHLAGFIRSILAGFICAVFVASLWTAIYLLMGLSLVSATLAASAAALVRAAIS